MRSGQGCGGTQRGSSSSSRERSVLLQLLLWRGGTTTHTPVTHRTLVNLSKEDPEAQKSSQLDMKVEHREGGHNTSK